MNVSRLKSLRESLNKSQREIAEDLGIERTTYVKYESGANNPSAKRLRQLAEYFNVSIDYLMDNNPDPSLVNITIDANTDIEKDKYIEKAKELFASLETEEQKKAALAQLEALVALCRK